MDRDVELVLAGGFIGLLSSVVALTLQRLWAVRDRANAVEREALDLTVRALLAWKEVALSVLSGEPNTEAQDRQRELDQRWEADVRLIPDRAAAEELLQRCKSVILAPRHAREARPIEEANRMIELESRVLISARKRSRDLA